VAAALERGEVAVDVLPGTTRTACACEAAMTFGGKTCRKEKHLDRTELQERNHVSMRFYGCSGCRVLRLGKETATTPHHRAAYALYVGYDTAHSGDLEGVSRWFVGRGEAAGKGTRFLPRSHMQRAWR
jgi:hypothetical protein